MKVNSQEIICPNCGKKLRGEQDSRGGVKLHCRNCGAVVYSKRITHNRYVLEVTNPHSHTVTELCKPEGCVSHAV